MNTRKHCQDCKKASSTPDPATKRMCGLQLMRTYTGLQRDQDAVKVALELNQLIRTTRRSSTKPGASTQITPSSRYISWKS